MKRYQNLHLADRSLFEQYRTLFSTDIDSAHALLSDSDLNNKKFQAADINDVTSDIHDIENYYFNNVPNELGNLMSSFSTKLTWLYDINDYVSTQTYQKDKLVWGKFSGESPNNNILYIALMNVPKTNTTANISGYNPFNLVYTCTGNEQAGEDYCMYNDEDEMYYYFTLTVPSGYTIQEGDIICFDAGGFLFSFLDSYLNTGAGNTPVGTQLTFTKYWEKLGLMGLQGYSGVDVNFDTNTDLDPIPYTETYNGEFNGNHDGWVGKQANITQYNDYLTISKLNANIAYIEQSFERREAGDIYYGCADVLAPSTNVGYPGIVIFGTNANGSSGVFNSTGTGGSPYREGFNDGQWHTIRIRAKKSGYVDGFGVGIYPYGSAYINDTLSVKNVKFFNLTEIYGDGNEPDVTWCDHNLTTIQELDYNWDSTKSYSEKDAVIYNNNIYVSKTDSNVGNNPETSSANWIKLVNSGQSIINLDNSSLTNGDILFETIT